MSNIQAQIDDLTGSIKVLDTKFSNIAGNTFSNYNQLSRIIAQQGNIYNTLYFGSGNLNTGNLNVNSNASINGVLNLSNGLLSSNPVNNRIGILNTNPQFDFDLKGNANISGNMTIFGNITSSGLITSVSGRQTSLIVGPNTPVVQPGTALGIFNGMNADTTVNGSISGSAYHQLSMGARNWSFSTDAVNDTIFYFGGVGGTEPNPDFEYVFKKNVGLQIQPAMTGNTTDFIEALKVLGTANITGNVTNFANLLIPNGRVGINTINPQENLHVIGNVIITGLSKLNGGFDLFPRYDSDFFAVTINTRYPLNLPFTIDLERPPTFKVLFSTTLAGTIGNGIGTTNVVCDITSQGINSSYYQSYGIRYSSNTSIIISTGTLNVALYFNGTTGVSPDSGFYRIYAY